MLAIGITMVDYSFMITGEQQAVDRAQLVQDTVRPFARLLSGPGCVLPPQESFDALAELYNAGLHPDFLLRSDYRPWGASVDVGYYANLPFRLALGIHKAVSRQASVVDTRATFDVYKSIDPAYIVDGPSMAGVRLQRAKSVLMGAVLTTAALGNLEGGNVDEAIELVKRERLLDRRQSKWLKLAVRTVSI